MPTMFVYTAAAIQMLPTELTKLRKQETESFKNHFKTINWYFSRRNFEKNLPRLLSQIKIFYMLEQSVRKTSQLLRVYTRGTWSRRLSRHPGVCIMLTSSFLSLDRMCTYLLNGRSVTSRNKMLTKGCLRAKTICIFLIKLRKHLYWA